MWICDIIMQTVLNFTIFWNGFKLRNRWWPSLPYQCVVRWVCQLFPLLIRDHTLSSFWIPNCTGEPYLAWSIFFLIENFVELIPYRKKLKFDYSFRGTIPQNKEEEASNFKSSHTVVINACLILSTSCHIPKEQESCYWRRTEYVGPNVS